MKKRLLSILLAAVMTVSLAACSESGSSADSSESSDANSAEETVSVPETTTAQEESSTESKEPPVDTYSKKETIDNVAFYVPESAISKVEQGVTFYQTNWGHIGVSQAIGTKCSYHSDYYIEKLSEGQDWKNIKKIYVQSSPALYYETKHPAGYDIRVLMNAAQGDVIFAISSTYSYEHARMQYEEFIKHITIKETYKTSTKSETVTTRSNVSIEYQNALNSAKSYLRSMAFSRKGLIEQLKYEKYSTAAATYAVDNCGANWNEQAVKSAKSYLRSMAFSKQELIEQLEYEGFTKSQAQYGVNAVYK